jgi:hypothetical protein
MLLVNDCMDGELRSVRRILIEGISAHHFCGLTKYFKVRERLLLAEMLPQMRAKIDGKSAQR